MPSENFYASYAEKPIVSVREALRLFQAKGENPDAIIGKANSYDCPSNGNVGYGYVLMRRKDVVEIPFGESAELVFGAGENEIKVNLWLINAVSLFPSKSDDDNALYMLKLADARWLADKCIIEKAYNVRSASESAGSYFSATTNAGTKWTWEEMFENIWDTISIDVLPFNADTPPEIPQGFIDDFPDDFDEATVEPNRFVYQGTSSWESFCDAVNRMGLQVDYDPLLNRVTYSQPGSDDDDHQNLLDDNSGRIINTSRPIGTLFPNRVSVNFPIVYESASEQSLFGDRYHTEEYEASSHPDYSEFEDMVSDEAAIVQTIFDDIESLGVGMSNASEMGERATSRGVQFYNSLKSLNSNWSIYTGIVKFVTCSKVQRVRWREYGDGMKTEIFSEVFMPWKKRPELIISGTAEATNETDGSCSCGDCLDSGSISACGALSTDAPLNYRVTLTGGLASVFGSQVILTHSSSCTWISDTFESTDIGDGDHDYFWKLVFAGSGIEDATLTLEDEV